MRIVKTVMWVGVIASFLCAAGAWAQTGRIRLQFEDEEGKPVPGVKVVFVHTESNSKVEIAADDKGKLSKIGMTVGSYSLDISPAGFLPLKGSMFIGLGECRIEGGFVQEAFPKGIMSWKNTEYYTMRMLKGGAVAGSKPAGFMLGNVEMTDEQGKMYSTALEAYKANDLATARTEFEKIVAEKPELPNTHFFLFEIYKEQGEYDKAVDAVQKGLAIKPMANGYAQLADVLNSQKADTEGARKAYQKAVELDPALATCYRDLGLLELQAGNMEEAKRLISKYVELSPQAGDAAWLTSVVTDIDKMLAKKSQ